MILNMRVNTTRVRSREEDDISGPMVVTTTVIGTAT